MEAADIYIESFFVRLPSIFPCPILVPEIRMKVSILAKLRPSGALTVKVAIQELKFAGNSTAVHDYIMVVVQLCDLPIKPFKVGVGFISVYRGLVLVIPGSWGGGGGEGGHRS